MHSGAIHHGRFRDLFHKADLAFVESPSPSGLYYRYAVAARSFGGDIEQQEILADLDHRTARSHRVGLFPGSRRRRVRLSNLFRLGERLVGSEAGDPSDRRDPRSGSGL